MEFRRVLFRSRSADPLDWKYKDKVLVLAGRVKKTAGATLTLATDDAPPIFCEFADTTLLKGLAPDDQVRVQGTWGGQILEELYLEGCTLRPHRGGH